MYERQDLHFFYPVQEIMIMDLVKQNLKTITDMNKNV